MTAGFTRNGVITPTRFVTRTSALAALVFVQISSSRQSEGRPNPSAVTMMRGVRGGSLMNTNQDGTRTRSWTVDEAVKLERWSRNRIPALVSTQAAMAKIRAAGKRFVTKSLRDSALLLQLWGLEAQPRIQTPIRRGFLLGTAGTLTSEKNLAAHAPSWISIHPGTAPCTPAGRHLQKTLSS